MMINDRWDGFRRGEIIDPSEYLTPEKNSVVNKLIQERQRLNPLTAERLGISEEEMPEFFKLLQQETQNDRC
jgi:plasmid maintenance system antidote protein VapI